MAQIQILKNKSRNYLYLNGGNCYITIVPFGIVKKGKKREFTNLVEDKDDFIAIMDKGTSDRYTKQLEKEGFYKIEKLEYNSLEHQIYFSRSKRKVL